MRLLRRPLKLAKVFEIIGNAVVWFLVGEEEKIILHRLVPSKARTNNCARIHNCELRATIHNYFF